VRTRPLVRGIVEVAGVRFSLPIMVNDRSDMRYPVLIGMDILKSGRFLIDPTKQTPGRYHDLKKKQKHAQFRVK
jgi:hypothetical protein